MQTAHNECAVCIFVSERRARGMRKRGRAPRPFPYLFYLGKEEERQKGRLPPRRPGRGGGPGGSRRGKRTAGPARRKEKAAGQGKGGGTPRKLPGASARSRAVKRPARAKAARSMNGPARGKRRTGKKNRATRPPGFGDGSAENRPETGQKQAGSDAVRGGIVHFSRSFGERSHKPPFFAPFGHPVVISER